MQIASKSSEVRELGVCSAFWILVTSVIFWPILSGIKSVFFGDLALYFIPQFANIGAAMAEGKLLLWNHTILGGVPHVGNPQGWLLYPTVWLNAFLPAWHVAGIIPILHIPVAAVGMHLLARRIGISVIGAAVAAGTFAFSSVLLTKAQFPNMVQAIAWTPWVLAAVITCIRKPTAGSAALLTVVGSLSICAGHAQITWMDALLCIVVVLWKCRSLRTLGFLAVASIGMVLLSAAYIFPMIEIAGWSGRDHMSLAAANRFRVPASGLVSYISNMHAGGNPNAQSGFRWSGNSWEVSAYFGLLAPVIVWFIALPLMFVRHRLQRLLLASLLLCVFGWWLSFGVQGGLFPFVFRFVPGAKAFHDPARFLHFVHIGVPLTLAATLTVLGESKIGRFLGLAFGVCNVATLVAVSTLWYPVVPSRVWLDAAAYYKPLSRSVLYSQQDRSVWLQYANPKSFADVGTDKAVVAFLKSGVPNIPGTWGVVSLGGYEPVAPKSSMSMQGWTGAEPLRDYDVLSSLGVTHLVTSSGTTLRLPKSGKGLADSAIRVTNGWDVHSGSPTDDVRIQALRTFGWESVSGQAVIESASVSDHALVVSGWGKIAYHPASFRIGLFFTLIALGILAGINLHTVQSARKV
ncbi:MAG: hypothetical protein RJB05_931 [Armatimonadota bacterium]